MIYGSCRISEYMKKPIYKILICDDSRLIRMKFRDCINNTDIEGLDFVVVEAVDGQDGVDVYRLEKPDLVFLDIVMPKKSGLEAIVDIKDFDPDAKIILESSIGTKENLRKALELGVFDFIQKPLTDEKIKEVLLKAMLRKY